MEDSSATLALLLLIKRTYFTSIITNKNGNALWRASQTSGYYLFGSRAIR